MSPRNPRWIRDELILALDAYIDYGTGSNSSDYIIELSSVLNQLSDREEFPDPSGFRNPNGVSMKLANFARLDPNYQGSGLSGGSKLEIAIWEELASDRVKLSEEVTRIKNTLTDTPPNFNPSRESGLDTAQVPCLRVSQTNLGPIRVIIRWLFSFFRPIRRF